MTIFLVTFKYTICIYLLTDSATYYYYSAIIRSDIHINLYMSAGYILIHN